MMSCASLTASANASGFYVELGEAGGQEFGGRIGLDGEAVFFRGFGGEIAAAVGRDHLLVHVRERVMVVGGCLVRLCGAKTGPAWYRAERDPVGTRWAGLANGGRCEPPKSSKKAKNSIHAQPNALAARFRNLSLFGCKAAGGKVLLFYRDDARIGKKDWTAGKSREPEGQGPLDVGRASSFVKTDFSADLRSEHDEFSSARYVGVRGSGLVAEVANAGEEHGQAEAVGGGDDFGVALRASGLNDGGGSGLGDFFDAIGEGEEGVGGGDGAFQRELGFHGADLGGIYAGHLSGADADGLAVARVDDGVGLHVFADFPGEEQGAGFFRRGSALGDDFEIGVLQGADVGVLH